MKLFHKYKYILVSFIVLLVLGLSLVVLTKKFVEPVLVGFSSEIQFFSNHGIPKNENIQSKMTSFQANQARLMEIQKTLRISDANFLTEVQIKARNNGLQVLSTQSQQGNYEKNLVEVNYELRLSGSFANLQHFIRELEMGDRPIRVDQYEFEGMGLDSRQDIHLMLRTWKLESES